jgi:hypothetical protein
MGGIRRKMIMIFQIIFAQQWVAKTDGGKIVDKIDIALSPPPVPQPLR